LDNGENNDREITSETGSLNGTLGRYMKVVLKKFSYMKVILFIPRAVNVKDGRLTVASQEKMLLFHDAKLKLFPT